MMEWETNFYKMCYNWLTFEVDHLKSCKLDRGYSVGPRPPPRRVKGLIACFSTSLLVLLMNSFPHTTPAQLAQQGGKKMASPLLPLPWCWNDRDAVHGYSTVQTTNYFPSINYRNSLRWSWDDLQTVHNHGQYITTLYVCPPTIPISHTTTG